MRRRCAGASLGADAGQQGQLWRWHAIVAIDHQRPDIGLLGQLGLHIEQVAMGGRIAGLGLQRFFKGGARFGQLATGRQQDPQVVVRFEQVGMRDGQAAEGLDGLVELALLGQQHAFEELQLHILGRVLPQGHEQLARLLGLSGLQGGRDGLHAGWSRGAPQTGQDTQGQGWCPKALRGLARKASQPAVWTIRVHLKG